MADKTEEKTEEVKAEEAKVAEAKAEETKTEEVKASEKVESEKAAEAKATIDAFDKKLLGEEDNSADEDNSDDDDPEKKAEEDAAETKDAGDDKAVEQTAEEKEIEADAEELEKGILADAKKAEDAKVVEAAAKVEADKKAEAEKKTDDDKPFDCGLDPEVWDKDSIAMFNKQGQEALDAKKAFAAEKAELIGFINQQRNDQLGDWLNRKIEGLGKDFHEVFGEGDFEDFEPASVESENRMKLAQRMNVVSVAYQNRGKPVPSKSKLFNEAVNRLFNKEKNKKKTEAETIEKLAAKKGQVIGSGSKKASNTSAAVAAQKVKDFDKMCLNQ